MGCDSEEQSAVDFENCLLNVDPVAMTDNQYSVEEYTVNLYPFIPTADQSFFGGKTIEELTSDTSTNIPILIGSNANEGFWSLMYYDGERFPNDGLTIDQRRMSEEEFTDVVAGLFSFYPSNVCLIVHVACKFEWICFALISLKSYF